MSEIRHKPVAFVTLHSGWSFIKIPKHDMILGVQVMVNKCVEDLDDSGKNIMLMGSDKKLKPQIAFNSTLNVQLFSNDEYLEHISLIDKGLGSK